MPADVMVEELEEQIEILLKDLNSDIQDCVGEPYTGRYYNLVMKMRQFVYLWETCLIMKSM